MSTANEEHLTDPQAPVTQIIFAQHGMTDNNKLTGRLARKVAPPQSLIIAPDLGYFATLFAITPLIEQVELKAKKVLEQFPHIPIRLIAVSLGGIIWTEVLFRNPEWWPRFESIIFLGVPVGGADLAKIFDPFGWGIGIAKELGKNRRSLAEKITAQIPTLAVIGNTTGGGDGTIPIECTKLKYAHLACLDGVSHPNLRTDPAVANCIRDFWDKPNQVLAAPPKTLMTDLIDHFRGVSGITDADARDFPKATTVHTFSDGTTIRTWVNIVGVHHVFIANPAGACEYSGFVGWVDTGYLYDAIARAIRLHS